MRFLKALFCFGLILFLGGCCDSQQSQLAQIDKKLLKNEIQYLSSDEFTGRLPGTAGGRHTETYIEKRFKDFGLLPGNGDSYRQQTPLIRINTESSPFKIGQREFAYSDDFVAWTLQEESLVNLQDSPLVFVGYGIHAPELQWDDYAGLDVRGKTVVMLINDPGYFSQDMEIFRGKAMTYYGRWVYKFEEAARQGAAGAIIIHDAGPASYPWAVVRNSWTGPQLHLQQKDKNKWRCKVEAWVQKDVGHWLFAQTGHDLDTLIAQASKPGFKGFELNITGSVTLQNKMDKFTADNVLGLLPGTKRSNEFVLYTAHWDHLGQDLELEGDQIYNGAFDNASGVAGLFALAKAITTKGPLQRSVMFVAFTAEEQGLLGSQWMALNPPVPTKNQVAVINMDGINIFGPTHDIEVVGYGFSELDDYLLKAVKSQGREITPDSAPERGLYFRSDHFPFAKVGVPGLYTRVGLKNKQHGERWMQEQMEKYVAERYHTPADEYASWWDFNGAEQDLGLLFEVGLRLANSKGFPAWSKNSEFRLAREKDRGQSAQ